MLRPEPLCADPGNWAGAVPFPSSKLVLSLCSPLKLRFCGLNLSFQACTPGLEEVSL